jgi:acetyltransferase-like isoleucine patch superfamily enzyme
MDMINTSIEYISSKLLKLSFIVSYRISLIVNRILSKVKRSALFPDAKTCRIDWTCDVKYPENIEIGQRVIIGPNCTLGAMSKLIIGDDVRISKSVCLETAGLNFRNGLPYQHCSKPITIGSGVWIGTGAIILGGAHIEDNCVVGAGSIVSTRVKANAVIVSSTTRTIGSTHPTGRSQ